MISEFVICPPNTWDIYKQTHAKTCHKQHVHMHGHMNAYITKWKVTCIDCNHYLEILSKCHPGILFVCAVVMGWPEVNLYKNAVHFFLRERLIGLELTNQARVAGYWALVFCSPVLWLQRLTSTLGIYIDSGNQTRILMLERQVLYPLSYLSNLEAL